MPHRRSPQARYVVLAVQPSLAYLRRLRLQKVHEELVTAAPGAVSVTEVAARWGFAHLGRFAAAYRSEFSERPSETMRSASAHTPANW